MEATVRAIEFHLPTQIQIKTFSDFSQIRPITDAMSVDEVSAVKLEYGLVVQQELLVVKAPEFSKKLFEFPPGFLISAHIAVVTAQIHHISDTCSIQVEVRLFLIQAVKDPLMAPGKATQHSHFDIRNHNGPIFRFSFGECFAFGLMVRPTIRLAFFGTEISRFASRAAQQANYWIG